MFCHVTRRLKGVVLKSLDIAKRFISRPTTSGGLRVIVETTSKLYAKGRKATHDFLNQMPVQFDSFVPELNYTLTPV